MRSCPRLLIGCTGLCRAFVLELRWGWLCALRVGGISYEVGRIFVVMKAYETLVLFFYFTLCLVPQSLCQSPNTAMLPIRQLRYKTEHACHLNNYQGDVNLQWTWLWTEIPEYYNAKLIGMRSGASMHKIRCKLKL